LERRQLTGLVRDLHRRCSLGAFSRLRSRGPCIALARYRLAGAVVHRVIAIATDLVRHGPISCVGQAPARLRTRPITAVVLRTLGFPSAATAWALRGTTERKMFAMTIG